MDINVCQLANGDWQAVHTLAYYSHSIPIFLALLLTVFVLLASKFSLFSKSFSLFTVSFCLWLIGDMIIWVSNDYYLITALWAPLDYINIIFYLSGAYFFTLFIRDGRQISAWLKWGLLLLSVPAWWITVTGQSITGFNQPYCEAFNNEWLTTYKLAVEWLVCLYIIFAGVFSFKKSDRVKRIQISVVSMALILFFATFSVTEYISSQTGVYEINLYSLFVLPVFLAMIIYSITNLKIFQLRLIGTQLLVYVLLIMVASQFFFLENATNQILTIITFITSLFFGIVLLRNVKKEVQQRKEIETLAVDLKNTNNNLEHANDRLKELDKQKTEFVSFATHQLRSPLTAMKGYSSLILEGDYGEISVDLRDAVQKIHESTNTLVTVVNDYLNISRIELGTMKYDFKVLDLKEIVKEVIGEQQPNIDKAGIKFAFDVDARAKYLAKIDIDKFKQVLLNIVDNSIKYTPVGTITASVKKDTAKNTVTFAIKDTGIGMAEGVIPKLFAKFSRAENANKVNIRGTGLGLYVAKEIVKAHGGKVWAESEGEGKGSQFYVELPGEKA